MSKFNKEGNKKDGLQRLTYCQHFLDTSADCQMEFFFQILRQVTVTSVFSKYLEKLQ